MANGSIGDHPLTDILGHGHPVYSPLADSLIREIAALSGTKAMDDLGDMLVHDFNPWLDPDIPRLEAVLTARRDQLRAEAIARGWEVD
jgi:hypothetical protein